MIVGIGTVDRAPAFAEFPAVQQRLQLGVGRGPEAIARFEEARHPRRGFDGDLEHPGRRLARGAAIFRLGCDHAEGNLSGREIQRTVEPLHVVGGPLAHLERRWAWRRRFSHRNLIQRGLALRRPHQLVDHAVVESGLLDEGRGRFTGTGERAGTDDEADVQLLQRRARIDRRRVGQRIHQRGVERWPLSAVAIHDGPAVLQRLHHERRVVAIQRQRQIQHGARAALLREPAAGRGRGRGRRHPRQRRIDVFEAHQRRDRGDDAVAPTCLGHAHTGEDTETGHQHHRETRRGPNGLEAKHVVGHPRIEGAYALGAKRQHEAGHGQRGGRGDHGAAVALPSARQSQRGQPEQHEARKHLVLDVAAIALPRRRRARRQQAGAPVQQVVGRHLRVALDRCGMRGGFEQVAAETLALL